MYYCDRNHILFTVRHSSIDRGRWNPKIIGLYSVDENRQYHHDARNLRYFKYRDPNETEIDLMKGYDKVKNKDESALENVEKIDSILRWLTRQEYLPKILTRSKDKSIFIGFRGVFATIMRTPYENRDDWLICAMKYENLIFLCSFYTANKKAKLRNGFDNSPFLYYGRRFEQHMLTDDPGRDPDLEAPINANEEFCAMVSNEIGRHEIIFGAEMDGVISNEKLNPTNSDSIEELNKSLEFIELKSTHMSMLQRPDSFKKFTSMKWWVQSYLPGIKKMIVGYRDNTPRIRVLNSYTVNELTSPTYAMDWNPAVCKNVLKDFLTFVECRFRNQPNNTLWEFEWGPGSTVITSKKLDANSSYNFLPDWFLAECETVLKKRRAEDGGTSENINKKARNC